MRFIDRLPPEPIQDMMTLQQFHTHCRGNISEMARRLQVAKCSIYNWQDRNVKVYVAREEGKYVPYVAQGKNNLIPY